MLWIRIRIRIRIIFLTWIRIRIKKNLDPHLDPHQSDKLDPETDPDLHQFGDDNPKYLEYDTIWALFQGFDPLFGS